jgi:hypothetical protein
VPAAQGSDVRLQSRESTNGSASELISRHCVAVEAHSVAAQHPDHDLFSWSRLAGTKFALGESHMDGSVRLLQATGLGIVLVMLVISCAGTESTTGPSATPASVANPMPRIDPSTVKPSATYTIGFSPLRENRAPFLTYAESGFDVSIVSADWISLTTYGNPQPFIEFYGPAGVTTTGELRITAGGAPFWLNSIDFYSSTTKIPYVIEGFLNSEQMYAVIDVIGNTFGAFARRSNPKADTAVQEVRVRLSNSSAPCCSNPMGVDNIVVSR